ncbi:MAG TPA: CAP domain-containing protein [Candidatus Deferrimicrobium sp.]|nr:CAP domain-containing protein [Candidatus Deferrimicrobium sp.]
MSRALPLAVLFTMALASLPAAVRADGPESSKVASTEQDVLKGLNRFRRNRGLAPLRMAPAVRAVAGHRSHSMERLGYFGHVAPGGQDAGDRLDSSGVRYRRWGEVIGKTRHQPLDPGGRWIIDWWKSSPAHRQIVLSPRFSDAGVGIAKDGGQTLWTVVFVD